MVRSEKVGALYAARVLSAEIAEVLRRRVLGQGKCERCS
jgi:hypothetical protein